MKVDVGLRASVGSFGKCNGGALLKMGSEVGSKSEGLSRRGCAIGGFAQDGTESRKSEVSRRGGAIGGFAPVGTGSRKTDVSRRGGAIGAHPTTNPTAFWNLVIRGK